MTDILEILRDDYRRFPKNQTYSLYAEDVYFKDPLTEFRGRARYKAMIRFMEICFINPHMEVHDMKRQGDVIKTAWTLTWKTPLPWTPKISVPGRSELKTNEQGLIASHVDYWNCSRLDVVKQHFQFSNR
jgi:hypothetical protein